MKKEIVLYAIIINIYKESLETELAKYEKEISDTKAALNDGYVDYNDRKDYQNEITGCVMICGGIESKLSRINTALESKEIDSLGLAKVLVLLDNDELRELNGLLEKKEKETKERLDFTNECLETFAMDFNSLKEYISSKTNDELLLCLINNSQILINETLHLEQPVSVKQYTL